ncbi:MAG: imidazole glycerol phosphate synthase subunit HisH [Prevotellaceae bacterium]|jgi:glutamine amidotransferase|nr:imidazole glycerol phosphate synthase subunit HisH [Prevotellaceae bacterium]
MKIAIVKYNAGNIFSVENALKRIGYDSTVTDDPEQLISADRVIFPGVGEASTTMSYLREHNLDKLILGLRQPVLGICVGLQLMCKRSEEGNVDCLGIFEEEVVCFDSAKQKVPHMGWNSLEFLSSPLFKGIKERSYVYFVHSYYATLGLNTIATTGYGIPFSAALRKGNFYAVQFHAEKSAEVGELILKNFLELQ